MEYLFVYAGVMPSKNTTRNENRQILFEISKRLLIVVLLIFAACLLELANVEQTDDKEADDDNKPLIAAVFIG